MQETVGVRKIGMGALARKLLIALWRFLEPVVTRPQQQGSHVSSQSQRDGLTTATT